MRKRQGFTLVECLMAISLIVVIFSTIAVSMSGLRASNRRIRQESQVELDLERLSFQLRADAHLAISADLEDSDVLLLTLAEDHSVRYTLEADGIERIAQQPKAAPHRETYRLPPQFTAQWQVDTERTTPMVSLRVEPGDVSLTGPRGLQTIRIDAAVGLLHVGHVSNVSAPEKTTR